MTTSPSAVTVYGASDDLVEVDGAISEEFNAASGEEGLLAFSDGTVLRYRYSGVWRFTPVSRGTARVEIVQCPEDDDRNYSDRVTLSGEVRWVLHGRDIAARPKRDTDLADDEHAVGRRVLDLPMRRNDADATTVREYLLKLLGLVWEHTEGFDGKRPFGNSGWCGELFAALVDGKLIDDEDSYEGDALIKRAILALH